MKMNKQLFGFLLTLVLTLVLLPGMSLTAYAENYALWVGGVQVTSDNLVIDSTDNGAIRGSATYDPADGTLRLNNFDYTGPGHEERGEGGGIDCRLGNLTIVLVGNNRIVKKDDSGIDCSHGIYFSSSGSTLTMEGSGTLVISFDSSRTGWKSNGIFCEPGAFVMNSGTVVANAGIGKESAGIYTDDGITFNGGTFTGVGNHTTAWESRGIYSHSTITVNGGTVTGTAPLNNSSGREAYGFHNSTLVINGGDVTAIGVPAISSTYYVKPGNGKTLQILAGDDKGNAQSVTEVPRDAKYVHITAISPVAVTGVSLDKTTTQTIDVGGKVSFTATVATDGATDKTVKWSSSSDSVKLYSDETCTTEVGTDATETLTVYAKGISAGSATVTVTSNADSSMSASCEVTVNKADQSAPDATGLPVRFEHYKQNGAPGIPEDIQGSSLNLTIIAQKGDEMIESKGVIPVTPGKRITTAVFAFDGEMDLTSGYSFDAASKTFSVSAELYNAAEDLPEPVKKYTVSVQSIAPAADDKGTFYLKILVMWDDGNRPAEEKIKVYALPEDEIGAYALRADGTKEYLLFHTYDICMNYLGRDELCRGYERCFHKESPYVNPFVKP